MSNSPRYRLSPLAEADLEEIWLYSFNSWSIEQADRYIADIVIAFEDLAEGGRTGSAVDVRAGYLKCPVGSHFIFYRRSSGDGSIVVVRVLHQGMDVGRHL